MKRVVLILATALLLITSCSKKTTEPKDPLQKSFIFVQGGTFNPSSDYNYTVTVSSFYIGKHEITQKEYYDVMGTNPSNFGEKPANPVEFVNWYNAIEYCNRRSIKEGLIPCYSYKTDELHDYGSNIDEWPSDWNSATSNHTNIHCDWNADGYRLPTEAEWKFASAGGILADVTTYAGSDQIDEVAWYRENAGSELPDGNAHPDYGTHPVGKKMPNELGIYDMSGNVWEWCWDIHDNYPSGDAENPTGADNGSTRTLSGGSWSGDAYKCEIEFRHDLYATYKRMNIGFRLVRVPE